MYDDRSGFLLVYMMKFAVLFYLSKISAVRLDLRVAGRLPMIGCLSYLSLIHI